MNNIMENPTNDPDVADILAVEQELLLDEQETLILEEDSSADDVTAAFTVAPDILYAALKEALNGAKQSAIYFAVSNDDTSDLWTSHMRGSLDDEEAGHLVIGAWIEGYDHTFVEIPVTDVTTSGQFLITMDKAHGMMQFARAARHAEVTIVHTDDGIDKRLVLRKDSGYDNHSNMAILMVYENDDLSEFFAPVDHRFDAPGLDFADSRYATILNRAATLANHAVDAEQRSMLFWSSEEVRHTTNANFDTIFLVANSRTEMETGLDTDEDEISWNVTSDVLKTIRGAAAMAGARYTITEVDGDLPAFFQVQYRQAAAKSTMLVQRQFQIDDTQSLQHVFTNGQLFHEHAKLFATVPSGPFFDALDSVMADQPNHAVVSVQIASTDAGIPTLELSTGDALDASKDVVQAAHGDSSLTEMVIYPDMIKPLKSVIGNAYTFQILTVPQSVEQSDGTLLWSENERAMSIVPLTIDDAADQRVVTPDNYCTIFWQ